MKVVNRIKPGEDIFSLLEKMIEEQKTVETKAAYFKYQDGDLEDYLDVIKMNYSFNKEKLSSIKNIESEEKRIEFIKMVKYIDSLDLEESNLVSVLLTMGVLSNKFVLNQLRDEDKYLLSTVFINIPIDNYEEYGVLLDSRLLDKINLKTNNDFSKRQILYDLLNNIDECDSSLKDLLRIIDNYNVNKIEKYSK